MAEKENDNIGFSGIGKRIENLKDDVSKEDITDWTQKTETSQKTNTDSANNQGPPKIYKQKIGLPFKLSFAKVFWGIISIVIIASIFSQNNEKKKTDYYSPPKVERLPAPEIAPVPSGEFQRSPSSNKKLPSTTIPAPVQELDQVPNDNDMVTDGQYRCSRYHHNKAQELEPTVSEKQNLEQQQTIVNEESQEIDMLNKQIETTHVDHSSQESIDSYNMLVNNYNARLGEFKISSNALQRNINNYNSKVNNYNNYLMTNCSKAF